MHDYQKLTVWQAARRLAVDTYRATAKMPRSEQFELVSQMRRSAVSIASNLAEGAGRSAPREFRRFVRIASGSACELETQILIASDTRLLQQIETGPLLQAVDEIKRMLHALDADFSRRA